MRYTKRLLKAQKLVDEQDARHFPPKVPCHDCAFRPGSPERSDPKVWQQLQAQAQSGQPFHCHFDHEGNEMPMDEQGSYKPALRPDGSPVGFPLCRGWVAFMDGLRNKPPVPSYACTSEDIDQEPPA
jgi:hypothetical protein